MKKNIGFKKKVKNTKGGMSIVTIGMSFILMVIALLVIEAARYYQSYNNLETVIQRSLTAAVEQNISYAHRADGQLYLYIDAAPPAAFDNNETNANLKSGHGAYADFLTFMSSDLKVPVSGNSFTKYRQDGKILYQILILSHSGTDRVVSSSPYMQIDGKITFYPMYSKWFGTDPVVTNFSYKSKNIRIEEKSGDSEYSEVEWDEG